MIAKVEKNIEKANVDTIAEENRKEKVVL